VARRPLLALALLCGSAVAGADDAELARCAAMNDPGPRLACYDALAGRAPDAPTAATFGLPPPPPPPEAESVEARLVDAPRSWGRGTVLKLDNGQTWKIIGEEKGYYPDIPAGAEVVIAKGLLGAYWVEVRALNRRFKVKRIS
jgi:hypothetical protein